jgi:hypothetical protein
MRKERFWEFYIRELDWFVRGMWREAKGMSYPITVSP